MLNQTHPPFKSIHFSSLRPGLRVLITGAVHGNEVCGTHAIERVIAEIEQGHLQLQSGSVSFVPITNPLAYQRQRREGERNLNRRLQPTTDPQNFEDHIANALCPLMAQHQVLLDLHSFQSSGTPFVMVGPENNTGNIEAFQFAKEEASLARCLGVSRFVHGWLSCYAKGAMRRNQTTTGLEYGIGTTEYMRSVGGYGLTLECGQHDDPNAPIVAYHAILNALTHLGVLAGQVHYEEQAIEALHIVDVIDKQHDDDRFDKEWESFDVLKKGDVIGYRHDNTAVCADTYGWIVFPNPRAKAHQEWFYLAQRSVRF